MPLSIFLRFDLFVVRPPPPLPSADVRSNAWALELATSQNPASGTLITFAQFLATTLSCLPAQLVLSPAPVQKGSASGGQAGLSTLPSPSRIRLRPRAVPLGRWAVQVVLYLSTSLLNNVAFAYDIPMAVHIVFRSGGLVVNMALGWIVEGRR